MSADELPGYIDCMMYELHVVVFSHLHNTVWDNCTSVFHGGFALGVEGAFTDDGSQVGGRVILTPGLMCE